ncbi:MAG TPA: hypothetical protein VE861_12105 [Gemmatimonadaceae bacterium]|nr:hypothetical protein [Gemmatimonadaceae bacterium]
MTSPSIPQGAFGQLQAIVRDERSALLKLARETRIATTAVPVFAIATVGIGLLGDGRWLQLPRVMPFVVWGAAIAGAAWIWTRRREAEGQVTTPDAVAGAIEHEQRLRRGAIRVATEAAESGPLGAHAAAHTSRALAGTSLPRAPKTHASLRALRQRALTWVAGALLAVVASAAIWSDGAEALANPIGAWRGTLLPELVLDAPVVALRGSAPLIRITGEGRTSLSLAMKKSDGKVITESLALRGDTVQRRLPVLDADVVLTVSDGRATSTPHRIRVTDKPYLGDVIAKASYPAYLGRVDEDVALAGVLVLPRGTVLTLRGHASVPLRSASLTSDEGGRVVLQVQGDAVDGELVAERSARWQWSADAATPLQELPASFALDIRADSAPQVQIAATSDTLLLSGATATVSVMATDDHALSSVMLTVRSGNEVVARREVLGARAPSFEGTVPLDLDALGLKGDDGSLRVDVTATDASPWRQVGKSRTLVLRRAGVTERREQVRATADSVAAGAASLAKQQQALAQQTADAARNARAGGENGQPMSFDAREKASQMAQQQRALQQQAQQLQQQAKQLTDQLKGAGALDSALAGKLADAQRMMQEAMAPQMMQRLQQLEQSAQRLDQQATRQSLDDLAKQQQALREQLERNAEMLKRAALEGSMETLRDEAQDMAKAQRQLADSSGNATAAQKAQQAERLARQNEALTRDINDLTKRLRENDAQRGAQRSEQARQNSEAATKQMQEASRDPQSAQQAAQKASQAMQQAADQLAQARQEQVNDWKQETTSELDQSIQEMMQLSQQERQMANAAQQQAQRQQQEGQPKPQPQQGEQAGQQQQGQQGQPKPGSQQGQPSQQGEQGQQGQQGQQAAQQMAADQATVQNGVQQAAQRLQEAAKRSQHVSQGSQRAMQEALQRAQEATQQAQKSAGQPGSGPQQNGEAAAAAMRDAAAAMERAASSLVRDRERAGRARSASGLPEMMEEMQQLAKQQQQVNGQAQGMSMMPGGESGSQAQQMAQQIARKQRQIAQRLDDVGGGDASGRADALAKEAKRLADAMERAASDPETAARREQFLQRLLDAGRTLRREDEDKQGPRESKPGIGTAAFTPPPGSATGAPASRVAPPSWEELRSLRDDERRAVLQYFERLNKTGAKP